MVELRRNWLPKYTDDETKKGTLLYLFCRFTIRLFVAVCRFVGLDRSRHYVIVEMRNGCRFGNQLFFISFGETLNKRYGYNVIYGTSVIKDYVFLIDRMLFYHHKIMLREKARYTIDLSKEEDFTSKIDIIPRLLHDGNVFVTGFYENFNLHDRELAQQLFHPSFSLKKEISKLYGDLSNTVSIHVRRGDFVNLGINQPKEWFLKAMSFFDDQTSFLVVSDDVNWCRKEFANSRKNIKYAYSSFKHDSVYIDFYVTVLCGKGNIISSSTFSWWGAFLNQNQNILQIAPFPWWNYNTTRNLYFEGLHKLEIEVANKCV